jgi:beta-barrel assembly-enhancing protease
MTTRFFYRFSALSTVLLFMGCAQVGQYVQDFNIVSVADERQAGTVMQQKIAEEMNLIEGTAANTRVNEIGARLLSVLPRQDFDYKFHVVQDRVPNAFTIPGGFIYVHTGLITFAEDDSELAGVMAHEIGHAYGRHPAKSISRAYGFQLLSSGLFGDKQGKLGNVALQIAQGGLLSKHGREDEREADDIGYALLKRSGYQTSGLLRFLRKIEQIQPRTSFPLFSSHPPTPERIARLEELEQGGDLPVITGDVLSTSRM